MKTLRSIITQIFIISLLLLMIMTNYLNSIKEYLPILWTLIISWSIFYSIKYRNGKIKNELRFFTSNDDYNKIYPFIIGVLLLTGGVFALLLMKEYLIFSFLMTFNGFLLIVSGFLFTPTGVIAVKNNELVFISGNQKNTIAIEKLSGINLFKDKIIFTDQTEKNYNLDHLHLELSDFAKISEFINLKINKQVEIKTFANKELS